MAMANLSMNEVTKKTGTTKLPRMPKTTFTLQPPILRCSVILQTMLSFRLFTFCKAGWFFAYVALSHYVSRKTFRIRLGHAPPLKTQLTGSSSYLKDL